MSEWLYLLGVLLGAIGIIAGGLAYRQEQIDDRIEEAQVQKLLGIVAENLRTLQALEQAQRIGPRHTACDTKLILDDLRAKGIALPPYEVEERCK